MYRKNLILKFFTILVTLMIIDLVSGSIKRTIQHCFECDSEKDGVSCVRDTWYTNRKACPSYLDHCYTTVLNSQVKRGCVGDSTVPSVEYCENSENCKHCNDDKCNDERIDGRTCVTCSSAIDATCATNTTFWAIEECQLSIPPIVIIG